ncbi:MAG: hypothetical protein HYV60_19680, partial [Planctomycetia bacterium]|nr:hypothetical protein [Planctomycetia bacterium]
MTETGRTSLQLRLPALAGSLVLFVAMAVAVDWWHTQQIPNIAAAYEAKAAQLAEQGHWQLAARCLERCLDLAPRRATAIIRFAEVSKRAATTEGEKAAAVAIYYRAVGL